MSDVTVVVNVMYPLCCTYDGGFMFCRTLNLVAATMFLQRLTEHEIRHMVAFACKGASWLEQPDEVDDERLADETHVSYVRVPRFAV